MEVTGRGEEEEAGQKQRGGLGFGPRLGLGLSPGPSPIICLRRGLARIQKMCVCAKASNWVSWPNFKRRGWSLIAGPGPDARAS